MKFYEELNELEDKLAKLGYAFQKETGAYLNIFYYAIKGTQKICIATIPNFYVKHIVSWEKIQLNIDAYNKQAKELNGEHVFFNTIERVQQDNPKLLIGNIKPKKKLNGQKK